MHINFVNDDKILIIIEESRFVVIMINDFISYTFIYFLKIKLKLQKILKKYLIFIKIKKISMQRIRSDNKEKYIEYNIIELMKEYEIK